MGKFLSFLFAFVFFCNIEVVWGQLPDGSVAPNWTMTDLNGQSWNLYDVLNEGKTVIIDVSATWCGPCWAYHNSNALETFYASYGPEGTDEAMVFFIEGDTQTSVSCLYDQSPCTDSQGNWVNGTMYPIINAPDNDMNNDYLINAFPTVYMVCPSKILREIGQPTANQIATLMSNNCAAASGVDNASILNYTGETTFCGNWHGKFNLQNLGTSPLTSCTIEVRINGDLAQTLNWSGNLSTYDLEEITLDPVYSADNMDVEISIVNPNGSSDSDSSDNNYEFEAQQNKLNTATATLTIVTDNYGTETYWELLDEGNDVVDSGGNPNAEPGAQNQGLSGGYANNTTVNETINIPIDGCYTFRIIDDYGDGICCNYGNGSFVFKDANNVTLFNGGEFGSELFFSITKGEIQAPFSVDFSTEVNGATVTVQDQTVGATVYFWDFGDGTTSTEANPEPHEYLSSGIYTISLTATDGINTSIVTQEVTVVVSGISNLAIDNSIHIFPNPSNEVLNINFEVDQQEIVNVAILDITGKIVKSVANQMVINGQLNMSTSVTDLTNGLYTLQIAGNNTVNNYKFTVIK